MRNRIIKVQLFIRRRKLTGNFQFPVTTKSQFSKIKKLKLDNIKGF